MYDKVEKILNKFPSELPVKEKFSLVIRIHKRTIEFNECNTNKPEVSFPRQIDARQFSNFYS